MYYVSASQEAGLFHVQAVIEGCTLDNQGTFGSPKYTNP